MKFVKLAKSSFHKFHIEGWAQDWMVVFPQNQSPHHEGIMKITTFLSVNNENLGAIARMSNGT